MVGEHDILPYVMSLAKFMNENGIPIKPFPTLNSFKSEANSKDVLGKTAWYSPDSKVVSVCTDGRHPKDCLRSIAHELVHHSQNLAGKMKEEDLNKLTDPKYAQKDDKMAKLEADAYLRGNLLFRKWEDQFK